MLLSYMGRYYSLELREKVISYIEREGSKSSAAFDVGLDTVYRWLPLHRSGSLRPKQRSNYSRKVSDEVILDYIKARPDDTLREIGLGVGLYSSKVWKYLKRLKITLYKERDEVKRSAFKERISSINTSTIVYIDESGVDNRIFRAYGRAPRGEKVYGNINGSRKRRFSVIGGGLMNRTFIAQSTFEGSCNSDVFNAWLEHVLIPIIPTGSTIIMDNAAFHKSAKTKQIIMDSGCHILFLLAYSPDMNPIENCWHTLKAKIRTATNDIADNLLTTLHNCLLDM